MVDNGRKGKLCNEKFDGSHDVSGQDRVGSRKMICTFALTDSCRLILDNIKHLDDVQIYCKCSFSDLHYGAGDNRNTFSSMSDYIPDSWLPQLCHFCRYHSVR